MSGELILIVEDDGSSRKLLRDVLRFKGFQTREAGSAEEGLAMAAVQPPALILMDVQLPGMSGIDALKRLRADNATRDIPIIAVTASVMEQQQKDLIDAGFDDFERKPIGLASLVGKVNALLGGVKAG